MRWYSWSEAALEFFEENGRLLDRLAAPPLIYVPACKPYGKTYSYPLAEVPLDVRDACFPLATGLLDFSAQDHLNLFTRMLDAPSSSKRLHKLFALMRAAIAHIVGDERAALHSPTVRQRTDDGFPLHADLFVTNHLWLVFDDVPSDTSGKSLFLPRKTLERIIARERLMTHTTRARLLALFDDQISVDGFDELYHLLHDEENAWSRSLAAAFARSQCRIKMKRGEGYLIDDRQWLHGRSLATGSIGIGRFRRLTYGLPEAPQERRKKAIR